MEDTRHPIILKLEAFLPAERGDRINLKFAQCDDNGQGGLSMDIIALECNEYHVAIESDMDVTYELKSAFALCEKAYDLLLATGEVQ